MRINYNVTAMLTNNALHRNDSNLSKAMERLSSGYKINSAKDKSRGPLSPLSGIHRDICNPLRS